MGSALITAPNPRPTESPEQNQFRAGAARAIRSDATLGRAAALHRRRGAQQGGAEPGHDLLADPEAVVAVARTLREAGVV